MTLHDYKTGEAIRTMTPEENKRYVLETALDLTHTGAVDGTTYGYSSMVYAQ